MADWLSTRVLVVGGAVVVVIAVVVTLLLGRSGGGSNDPGSVAQSWADAVYAHDAASARGLQCRPVLHTEIDLMPMTTPGLKGYRVEGVRSDGTGRWQVRIDTVPSGTTFAVAVTRTNGQLRVCD